jgi:hypothetical protein
MLIWMGFGQQTLLPFLSFHVAMALWLISLLEQMALVWFTQAGWKPCDKTVATHGARLVVLDIFTSGLSFVPAASAATAAAAVCWVIMYVLFIGKHEARGASGKIMYESK